MLSGYHNGYWFGGVYEGIMNTKSKVNLTKKIQTAEGLRWCPVVKSVKGHVRPDLVLVNGFEARHPEGTY